MPGNSLVLPTAAAEWGGAVAGPASGNFLTTSVSLKAMKHAGHLKAAPPVPLPSVPRTSMGLPVQS